MRLAVFSDVHGNLPALEAVLEDMEPWGADVVVMNGDLINRGPNSVAVLELLQRTLPRCHRLQGNHERFIHYCATHPPKSAIDQAVKQFTYWSVEQLKPYLDQIEQWPESFTLTAPDGGTVCITHGSQLGNREGITPEMSDEELTPRVAGSQQLFIASHTHRPFCRTLAGQLIVNVGSVGASFDRNSRAAYGRFSWDHGQWQVEIRRVAYDRQQLFRDYHQSGFLEEGGSLTRVMLAEQILCRGLMGPWMRQFHALVVEQQVLTLQQSVDRLLAAYL